MLREVHRERAVGGGGDSVLLPVQATLSTVKEDGHLGHTRHLGDSLKALSSYTGLHELRTEVGFAGAETLGRHVGIVCCIVDVDIAVELLSHLSVVPHSVTIPMEQTKNHGAGGFSNFGLGPDCIRERAAKRIGPPGVRPVCRF